jgi:hypothetical protein
MMLFRLLVILPLTVTAFVLPNGGGAFRRSSLLRESSDPSSPSIDVSDLGLTMDDFNKPLPSEVLESLTSSGCDSTNRLDDDGGCEWSETLEAVSVTLNIPGLRGQPPAAVSVLFSTTTMSVSVFGRVVWSAILFGSVDPEGSSFEEPVNGADMVPVIHIHVKKADAKLWGGYILQIGENSIL